MNVPNFIDGQIVDKNGFLTPTWKQVIMQLFTELQKNLSNEGYIIPKLSSTDISSLGNIKSESAIVYDNDTKQLKVNINGSFKVVTVT